MTDRELLEAAAKAAGLTLSMSASPLVQCEGGWRPWNPLADDGDALRLAVALEMTVGQAGHKPIVWVEIDGLHCAEMGHGNDPCAATRRAIARAAARVGSGA